MSETPSGPLGPDHGYGPDIDHVLLSEEQIAGKIRELADRIAVDYAGREVLLVGVLKGAVLFMSDFARALQRNPTLRFDPLHVTVGLESVILVYKRMTGDLAAELFAFDESGKIVRSISHYHLA